MIFGKENSEIIICKEGKKHIADIKTKKGIIIELQNSKISYDTIKVREEFYGVEMLWIVNARKFEKNFIRTEFENQIYDTYSKEFEYYAKINGFTPKYKPSIGTKKELRFKWQRPHESWTSSQRNVYFDLGDDILFCITEGIGEGKGKGYEISKLEFIRKHEGDESLISIVL